MPILGILASSFDNTVAARGLFGGGLSLSPTTHHNVIDYITMATTGNATDFGDLSVTRGFSASCGSSTRGVWANGGLDQNPAVFYNVIDYVTIATTGNATDFGDMLSSIMQLGGTGSETRGIFAGGAASGPGSIVDVIQYITIASTGNSTDFGDLTGARYNPACLSSPTRAIFAGGLRDGDSPSRKSVIDYVTIATTGNATNFGNLLDVVNEPEGASSATRGVIAGGNSSTGATNVIQYITIATTGNAIDFGDLTVAGDRGGSASSSLRGVWAGGYTGAVVNTIDYVEIATLGNAIDFGDQSVARIVAAGCSNGHGGL
jgi:hypothetical protein